MEIVRKQTANRDGRKGKEEEAGGTGARTAGRSPRRAAPPGAWFRENLEAIAVAVIMALVIRHFCVEAFRIPTSSMEPTLYGNNPELGRQGDRILVNKFVYRFTDPKRWDVIVFKYPLDKTKNFIKRLVGLPGEEIKIWGGNIYVRDTGVDPGAPWILARKPDPVQAAVWQPLYPECPDEPPGYWQAAGGADFRDEGEGSGTLTAGGEGPGWLDYRGKITARNSFTPLGEVRLDFDAALAAGTLLVRLDLGEIALEAQVPSGLTGESRLLAGGEAKAAAPFALPPGRRRALAFTHVDGCVRLEAGGRTVLEYEYDPGPFYSREMTPRLRVGVSEGGEVRLSGFALHRDIHYIEDDYGVLGEQSTLKIPSDCFFVLGDNCTRSKDSRLWRTIRFRLKDGRVLEGEYDRGEHGESFSRDRVRGEVHLLDTNGHAWLLTRDEVEDFDARASFSPFVPRELLIGQAFMVFWRPKRLHLIR